MTEATTTRTIGVKDNNFKIVGKLTEVKLEERVETMSGKEAISGSIVINAMLNGEENVFPIFFYARKVTEAGAISKLFTAYQNLSRQVGKKLEISGTIEENRYFNNTTGQMASTQRLTGKFAKEVADNSVDAANFEVTGFVAKGLVEKQKKDGTVYAYELTLGQANYNGSRMNVLNFQIDPSERKIINVVEENYTTGTTVNFHGDIRFITRSETVTKEAMFGEAQVQVYTNNIHNYFITGGSAPIVEEREAYSMDEISALKEVYAAKDIELAERAKVNVEKGTAAASTVATAPTNRQTALI